MQVVGHSACRGMLYGQSRRNRKLQFLVSFAQCVFNAPRCVSPGKKKSQIACALWPGGDRITQPGGDRQFGDPVNGASGFLSRDTFQNSTHWDRNHHDSGGILLAWRIRTREFERMAQKQLFEANWPT